MARQLDERQQADLTAFVNALADRAGYTTTAEWSRDSGYPAPNLSNLRNGRGAIDGYNLLRLIRAAAARAETAAEDLATELAGASTALDGRLRAVEDGLTALASEIRRSLESPEAAGSASAQREKSQGDRGA